MTDEKVIAGYSGPMHTDPAQQKMIWLLRCGHTVVRAKSLEIPNALPCDKCARGKRLGKKLRDRGLDK